MAQIQFDESLRQVLKALDDLPVKIETKLARAALKAAAQPMLQEVQRRVPVATGTLANTIRVSSSTQKSKGKIIVKIVAGSRVAGGGRRGAKGAERGAFYAHMVEFGTAPHVIPGPLFFGGKWHMYAKHPGTKAQPFMRPAFDTSDRLVVDAYSDYMRKALPRALDRAGITPTAPAPAPEEA